MIDLNDYSGNPEQIDIIYKLRSRCESICEWMLSNKCSIRQAAEELCISRSTLHRFIHTYIRDYYDEEYRQILRLLDYNRKERFKPRKYWRGLPW